MQSWRGRKGMVVIREISENWRRLFADLIQPPNTSTQMAGRRGLRAASCFTRRDPSLWGLLSPLNRSFLFGARW